MILDEILEILKNSKDKAYTVNEKSYTYNELYKFVCNIYHFLLRENEDRKPIAIYGHKEIHMKATFLACSFAGITYVPIDENLPNERVEQILKQVKPNFIIGNFYSENYKYISKKQIYEIMNNENYEGITKTHLKSTDIYYIIFTSGSTGIPKGVKVTYKNLDSCVKWLKNITRYTKRCSFKSSQFFI